MKHFIIIVILIIISTFLVYFGLTHAGLFPVEASTQAVFIDQLFNIHIKLISFLFSLIIVILFYSLIVFRKRKGQTGDGAHITGNTNLEIIWTLIPIMIVIYLAYVGAYTLGEVRQIDQTALQVKVNAGQWYWNYQYPDYNISTNELYLPLNRQVDLQMTSKDVIHSFWVPEFRVKQDIVPGQTTELRITPTIAGDYNVRCAELCGASHAYMEGLVRVVDQADFDAWVKTQQNTSVQDPVLRGQQLVNQYGCTTCHSLDGSQKIGPTWLHLADSQVPLEGGKSVTADKAYLVASILEPNLDIVRGFPSSVMPNFKDTLDQTQVEAIVAFIQSLK